MIDFDYGFYHIERVLRIVRSDAAALNDMDITSDGFWRSFAAIIWALPAMFFSWVVEARDLIMEGVQLTMVRIVIFSAIIELVLWFLPIFVLALILKPLGFAHRFSHLIIVRNWLTVPIVYAYIVIILLGLTFGTIAPLVLLAFIFLLVVVGIQIRVTRIALECDMVVAAALVVGEFMILIAIMFYLQSALGISPSP